MVGISIIPVMTDRVSFPYSCIALKEMKSGSTAVLVLYDTSLSFRS